MSTSPVLRDALIRLVDTVGEREARAIFEEVSRRVPDGGSTREWLLAIGDVTAERYPAARPTWQANSARHRMVRA